jgi:hypothetical protein
MVPWKVEFVPLRLQWDVVTKNKAKACKRNLGLNSNIPTSSKLITLEGVKVYTVAVITFNGKSFQDGSNIYAPTARVQ